MALYSIVPNAEMTERFDSEFYTPDFLLNDKKLRGIEHQPLSEILIDLQLGYTGPTEKFYELNGINYLSSKNVIDGTIEITDATDTISRSAHKNELSKTAVKEGDVLITRTGTVGKSAVVTQYLGEANIAAHLIALRINPSWDSYYICGFLNSSHGRKQSKRHQRGTIIQGLSVFDIPQFVIPTYEQLAQKYIGDKVRQAEQLRAWANVLYRIPAFIDAMVQGVLPLPLTHLLVGDKKDATKELTKFLSLNIADADTKKFFRAFIAKNKMGSVDTDREFFHINTVTTDAIEDFLSAQTYRPAITQAFDIITSAKHNSLQAMCLEPIRQGATPKFSTTGKKCIKSKQTRDLFLDETGYETVDPDAEQNKRIVRLKRNDILVTRQGAGTVGRASIFLDDEETYITDSLFLVRIDSNKAHPAFIAGFLRSYTGQRLIEKGVYGSTGQLNLSSGALRNIPVPDVDLDFQNFLGEALCTADTLFKLSTRLIQAAKTLVEALIEGQLTEQQLIQAQQALDDGDNSLDQAILSKLSSEGYAIEGATPLFSDIDELYRLLESAAQTEAEE